MGTVNIRIENSDGTIDKVDLELSLEGLTLRESARLEKQLGAEVFEKLMASELGASELAKPSIIQAIVWAKLKTLRPDVEVEAFDVELEELAQALTQPNPLAHGPTE